MDKRQKRMRKIATTITTRTTPSIKINKRSTILYKHPFKINCQQLKNMLECQLRMLKIV